MNATLSEAEKRSPRLSDAGKRRLLAVRGEPLFFAEWRNVLFIHFEIAPEILQRELPFELDLRDGKAFVSLVAFTMRDMRPRIGGKLGALLFKPIATHSFLNVRTYVKHNGEPGICFLTEWLSNWLSVQLGPVIYGLPYRYAKIDYRDEPEKNTLTGTVESRGAGRFSYEAKLLGNSFAPCESGSLDEFLLERYTSFNWRGAKRFFRIWHPSWPQMKADVSTRENALLTKAFPWFQSAKPVGANYSPGFREVWMGRAHFCK
ncbi:MAG TPA: DUF2071 domain-containing protein [Verrucomicrobiae bacterium]|nr:DUF2071 domain-containing protein [Verrucomicrobiae bacterium]